MLPLWTIVLLAGCVYMLIQRRAYVNRFNKLPGIPVTIGLVGVFGDTISAFKRIGQMGTLIEEFYDGSCLIDAANKSKGGVFAFWIGPKPVVILYAAEFIEKVLTSKRTVNKGPLYRVMEDWMGEGLITSSGHKWSSRRKLLNPAFSVRRLDSLLPSLNANANTLVRLLTCDIQSDGTVGDLRNMVYQFALSNIFEFATGAELPFPSQDASEYIRAVHDVHESLYTRAFLPLFRPLFALTSAERFRQRQLQKVNDFTLRAVRRRLEELKTADSGASGMQDSNNDRVKHNFIDILLAEHMRAPNDFSMADIREEVNTTLMAGFETASPLLTWTIYLLGLYPRVQEKLHNELDAMFEGKESLDDSLTMDDMKKLTYTEAVIKEAHRVYSTAGFIARLLEEDTQLGDHVIPGGTEIIIPILSIHKSAQYWPNPGKFEPERFLHPSPSKHAYAFIPFSSGPRSCIGLRFATLELKLALAKIFHRFSVTSLDRMESIRVNLAIARRIVDPIRVKLTARQCESPPQN